MNVTIDSVAAYESLRERIASDPGEFWDEAARFTLHWHRTDDCAWLTRVSEINGWCGWTAPDFAILADTVWNSPWSEACDAASLAPLLLWFRGGLTNAAFNELDRHILSSSSRGNSGSGAGGPALLSEMPGGASTFGASAPTTSITREDILAHSAAVAAFLSQSSSLGHRVAIHMLNGIATAVWIEGCKRAAVPFTAGSAAGAGAAFWKLQTSQVGSHIIIYKCFVLKAHNT